MYCLSFIGILDGIRMVDLFRNTLQCRAGQFSRTNHLGSTTTGFAPQHDLMVPNAALKKPHDYNGLANEKCISS